MRLLACLLALTILAFAGPQHTEVVQLRFSDHLEETCTLAYMSDMVFNQYSNWLLGESHGVEWLEGGPDVWDWTLPHDSYYYCQVGGQFPGRCNTQKMQDDARVLAAPYFDVYTQDLVVFYTPGFGGGVGGGRIIFADCFNTPGDLKLLQHEGGHAQGLAHSTSWVCPNVDVGSDYFHTYEGNVDGCIWTDYGDPYSLMGSDQTASRHFSSWEQDLLGWKPASTIKTVAVSSSISLTRFDIATTEVQEVRIPLPTPDYYYSINYQPSVGVLIRLKVVYPYGPDFTEIVNGTYPDPWNHPLAITATNPFVDIYRSIQVRWLSSDTMQATISVSFGSNSTPTPPPTKKHPRPRSKMGDIKE